MGEIGALIAAQGIGVAAGAAGTFAEAQALRGQSNFERSQANINLAWSRLQQEDVIRRGDLAASRQLQATRRLIGAQRAAGAASGIDPLRGSVMELGEEAAMLGAIDAATIRSNAYRQALGLRAEQADIVAQTRLNRIARRSKISQSIISSGLQAAEAAATTAYFAERYEGLDGVKRRDVKRRDVDGSDFP